jgi:hypothetical protein
MENVDREFCVAPVREYAPRESLFMRRKAWGFDPDPEAPMNSEERRVLADALALLRKALVKR